LLPDGLAAAVFGPVLGEDAVEEDGLAAAAGACDDVGPPLGVAAEFPGSTFAELDEVGELASVP